MEDLQEQLAALRRQIARIDRKYAEPAPARSAPPQPGRFIEELLTGEVVRTPQGEHFETEKLWERHRRHGSVDISDLAALPDDFADYACGTNGGPPSIPLMGWGDFRRCRPDAMGLREVYFRYDDELEYWAKANNIEDQMEQVSGTKAYGFPIIASVLIDGAGVVEGIRMVSDPRDTSQNRDEAYFLRNFLTARFGRDQWQCQDLPPDNGETPVDGIFIKQNCRKEIDARTSATLSTRYLRKAGESRFDPHTGRETTGQYESTVRFELVRKSS